MPPGRGAWGEGNFAQVALLGGMDEPPAKLAGWIRIHDEQGQLTLWLHSYPG